MKEWWKRVKEGLYWAGYDYGMDYPLWIVRLLAFRDVLHHEVGSLECRMRGHDLECDDWGGPESGGMGAHCNRCGWGFRTVLY